MLMPVVVSCPKPSDPLMATAAAMCRAVAPIDLRGHPIYIVRLSEVPHELGGGARCSGWTDPILDAKLKGVIGRRWVGRGPCMVADARLPKPLFMTVVIHELAHILERDTIFHEFLYATADEVRVNLAPGLAAMNEPLEVSYPLPTAIADHGPQFFRLATHAAYRAKQAGFTLCDESVLGRWFDRSPFTAYVAALAGEPERMARLPFSAIRATPIPPAMVALWEADAAKVRASAPQLPGDGSGPADPRPSPTISRPAACVDPGASCAE